MLYFWRKQNEEVVVGESVIVRVIQVKGNRVQLGFEGPRDVPVDRREVRDGKEKKNDEEQRSQSEPV